MNWFRHSPRCPDFRLVLFAIMLGAWRSADALGQVSIDNLQAAVRTLNFIESLPTDGVIVVGVVYAFDVPGSQVLAVETANTINAMRGPNVRTLRSVVLAPSDLDKFEGRLDVIYLVTGVAKHPERILGAMGRLHLMSISDDPTCMDTGCCVLLVRTGQRVEISLNTSLAGSIGARFSMVFMMVVKRR